MCSNILKACSKFLDTHPKKSVFSFSRIFKNNVSVKVVFAAVYCYIAEQTKEKIDIFLKQARQVYY